jgi:hypothetical protein
LELEFEDESDETTSFPQSWWVAVLHA